MDKLKVLEQTKIYFDFVEKIPQPKEFEAKQKQCKKGLACGNSCIAKTKTCRKPLTAEQQQTVTKVRNADGSRFNPKKTQNVTVDKIRTAQLAEEVRRELDIPKDNIFTTNQYYGRWTHDNNGRIFTPSGNPSTRPLNNSIEITEDKDKNTLDANRAITFDGLPKGTVKEKATKMKALFATLPDGLYVQIAEPEDKDLVINPMRPLTENSRKLLRERSNGRKTETSRVARELGLDTSNGGIYSGVIKNGVITPVTKRESDLIRDVRESREQQTRAMMDQIENLELIRRSGRSILAKALAFESQELLDLAIETEDKWQSKILDAEDELLGRKPSKVESFKAYEKKAEDWAKKTFGAKTTEGANGFTLEQTKAHDVSHPITHELTGMDSDQIDNYFSGFKSVDGSKNLLGEEAIVNVIEQLSRGGNGIEAAILNGVRLARVLTRGGSNPQHREYARSPEFVQKLSDLAHKAYRNDNFSPLIKYVTKSNRKSGTVTAAGDDFTNTASGG